MIKIKFAVVGLGHIGKRHAKLIEENPNAELAALIDIKCDKLLSSEYAGVPFYHSLKDLLRLHIDADVVIIATPNGIHAKQAIECLQAGKHVLIEKPMALKTKDAKKIIEASKKYKKHVFVVMQNRCSPPVVWLKEIISKNILGSVYMVQLNCFWNRDERYYTKGSWHGSNKDDGGVLFTQFSHFIDMIFWLFGDVKNIRSNTRLFNHKKLTEFKDSGIITFEFGKKSIGCINFTTAIWDKNFESGITVIAENGTVKIAGQYMDAIEYCHIKNYTIPQLNKTSAASNHAHIIQNVIEVLNGRAAIHAGADEGLQVIKIIEKIYKKVK